MDRVLVYDGALPQTTDLLQTNKFQMVGQAFAMQAALGTGTVVNGLSCLQTSTPSLQVVVGPGSIYGLDQTDATAYGDLGTDTSFIVKQGILNNPVVLTLTPPLTPGYNQMYVVEAVLSDVDAGSAVLSYENSLNPAQPFSGPSNSGVAEFTLRTNPCTIALKAGVPAPAGSEVQPAADPGYTPLYTITVTNGQTAIINSQIILLPTAPFFPTLPSIPSGVQTNKWIYSPDTSVVANVIVATLTPPPIALTPGLVALVKVGNTVTGPTTLNVNGLGAIPVHRSSGAQLSANDIVAGADIKFVYDGAAWQILNYNGLTSGTTNNFYNNYAIPYGVDGGGANAMAATFTPAVTVLTAGMLVMVKVAVANTGPTTLTPVSLAATPVLENGISLLPNAIVPNQVVLLAYDGANFQKLNSRWQYFSFDLASPPASPVNLQVGDQLNITFTGVTSVPHHVACVPGIYETDIIITSSDSICSDCAHWPNDIEWGAGAFRNWVIENHDDGIFAAPYIGSQPNAFFNNVKDTCFGIDLFKGPRSSQDSVNDAGPFHIRCHHFTFKQAKMFRWHGGIWGGPCIGHSHWPDTGTDWTSLGTFFCFHDKDHVVHATISGVIVVKRLA